MQVYTCSLGLNEDDDDDYSGGDDDKDDYDAIIVLSMDVPEGASGVKFNML